MAGDALGVMNIVLSADSATFSQGIEKAQRQLNQLAQASTRAGHASVTSTQAASAALRVMSGDMTNNIRAVERFVGMIPGVGAALKMAFPLVGGIAFAGLLVDLGEKVEKFVKDVETLPDRIRAGFNEMHSASQLANDELGLTNARLQNEINKLEGKPQNNLATALYETRIEADKLADSLANAANKVSSLLDKNGVGFWTQMATFGNEEGTQEVEGSIESFESQLSELGYKLQKATVAGDKSGADSFRAQIEAKQDAALQWSKNQIDFYQGVGPFSNHSSRNVNAVVNDLQGFAATLYDQKTQQMERKDNSSLESNKDSLTAQKENAAQAKEAREQAAHAQMQGFEQQFADLQQSHALQLGEEMMFWRRMRDQTSVGSENWLALNKKVGQERQNLDRQFAAHAKENAAGQMEIDGVVSRVGELTRHDQLKSGDDAAQGYHNSNATAAIEARNQAREEEARIADEAGRSITRYDAANQIAAVHAKEFADVMLSLRADLDVDQRQYNLDPSRENAQRLQRSKTAVAQWQAQGSIQSRQDEDAINGRSTSAAVGFVDSIDEFTLAMRDGARQVSELFRDALGSFNGQILNGVTGQHTDFKGATMGTLRNVAGLGLQHAEGSIMGLLGLGSKKKPTGAPGDAIHAIVDNMGGVVGPASSVLGSAKGLATKAATGGFGHLVGSLLSSFLPGFASGGAISPGTWAVVGEQGPELFHSGGGGSIVPNHKIATAGAGGGGSTFSYTIDARGTDPVQTEMRVRSAIVAAHQSSVHQAVKQVHQQSVRQPTRSR